MNRVKSLSGDGDFGDFVERYLQPVSISGREVMCVCIFHEDTNASMQFNLDKGLFTCFACQTGGSYRKIEQQLGVDHRNVEVGLDVIYRKLADLRKSANGEEGPRIFPESTLTQYNQIPTNKWKERKLNATTCEAFDLGYDFMNDAMTIPVRTINGDLLGITRRFCAPDAEVRYKYPKGFHKSDHMFASWMVANDHSSGSVALTEGAIDCMTLWQYGQPAMAIYGSYVSEAQIRIMRRLGLTQITLFFDNDKAGADLTARCRGWKQVGQKNGKPEWKRAPELDLRRFFDVKAVDWSGVRKSVAKDANDLGIIKARNMLASAHELG